MEEKLDKIIQANDGIQSLLINLTDRIQNLQQQNTVMKEIIGNLYEKHGELVDRLYVLEEVQPEEVKEEIKKRYSWHPIFKMRRGISSAISFRKLKRKVDKKVKARLNEPEQTNDWL